MCFWKWLTACWVNWRNDFQWFLTLLWEEFSAWILKVKHSWTSQFCKTWRRNMTRPLKTWYTKFIRLNDCNWAGRLQNESLFPRYRNWQSLCNLTKTPFMRYFTLSPSLLCCMWAASCERSFFTMRQIKTYLRKSMRDDRLSNLAVLSIESKRAIALDLDNFVDEFDRRHQNRRIN